MSDVDPATPCLEVWVDEGGDEQPKRHYVPFGLGEGGEVHIGYTEIAGRAFMRTLGDALVASDRIVRVEHFPLPPWGETPDGDCRWKLTRTSTRPSCSTARPT